MEKFKKVIVLILTALKDNVVKIIQGALIGAGGVLPGVSGGVLAVLFGVYKPLMRLLAHPLKELKNSIKELWPIIVGFLLGYIGIAKVLEEAMKACEAEALVLFVGMTIGIMPSLYREAGEKGRNKFSWISLSAVLVIATALLYALRVLDVVIVPNFVLNMFGGFCLALSIIAPGMSASILMLPLQVQGVEKGMAVLTEEGDPMTLYEHITGAIGNLRMDILLPVLLGAAITFVLLTRLIDWLMTKHYSVMFHGIIGLVIAATIFTAVKVPGEQLLFAGLGIIGVVSTLLLDKFNSKVEKPPVKDSEEDALPKA